MLKLRADLDSLGFIREWTLYTGKNRLSARELCSALHSLHFSFYNSITVLFSRLGKFLVSLSSLSAASLAWDYRVFYFRSIASWFTIPLDISLILSFLWTISPPRNPSSESRTNFISPSKPGFGFLPLARVLWIEIWRMGLIIFIAARERDDFHLGKVFFVCRGDGKR